jgi:hypothetical protein
MIGDVDDHLWIPQSPAVIEDYDVYQTDWLYNHELDVL